MPKNTKYNFNNAIVPSICINGNIATIIGNTTLTGNRIGKIKNRNF